MDTTLTSEDVKQMSIDSSGEEFEEKIGDPSTDFLTNDDSFQSMLPESPMEVEGELDDPSDTELNQ